MFRKKKENEQPYNEQEVSLEEAFAVGTKELKDYHNFAGNLAMIHANIRDMTAREVADELSGDKNKTDWKPFMIYGGFAIIMIAIAAITIMQYQDGAGWMQKYAECNGQLTALQTINEGVVHSGVVDARIPQKTPGGEVNNQTDVNT